MPAMVMTSEYTPPFVEVESDLVLRESLQNLRVLLVEDDLDNQQLFQFLLQSTGMDLHLASDGAAAVERLGRDGSSAYDVILMDMQMPVMDGFEATAELRKLGVQIPIVALTAYTHATERDRCHQVGCSAFLAKPFTSEELIRVLTEVAESRSSANSVAHAPSEFSELLQRYRGSLADQLRVIETSESTGDVRELCRVTHRLRGVAGNYGFPAIASIAGTCEDALRGCEDTSVSLGQLKVLMRDALLTLE